MEVMDNALVGTCPSGELQSIIVAEADSREPLEASAANIGLWETTVQEADQMRFPG